MSEELDVKNVGGAKDGKSVQERVVMCSCGSYCGAVCLNKEYSDNRLTPHYIN